MSASSRSTPAEVQGAYDSDGDDASLSSEASFHSCSSSLGSTSSLNSLPQNDQRQEGGSGDPTITDSAQGWGLVFGVGVPIIVEVLIPPKRQ